MGGATSIPAAAPSVVTSAAAATTAIKGLHHHEQKVIPRMDRPTAAAFVLIAVVMVLASFNAMPVSVHMLLVTVATIYIGSRFALKCWRIEGANGAGGMDANGNEVHNGFVEQMQTKDAMMFPVIGSCVLFSLYMVYKFLPKDWVNFVIKAYFFIFGCIVLAQKLSQIMAATLPESLVHKLLQAEYNVPNPMWTIQRVETALMPLLKVIPGLGYNTPPAAGEAPVVPSEFWLPLSLLDIIALTMGIVVSLTYVLTGSWVCSNLFGIAFSVQGIEMLSLGSYLNGCILLSGLFVYDVFWVFGTDVMVTVAKSFDAPIKLLFPQFGATGAPSMLGLGDIVIPGIFIALLLRYDIWRSIQRLKGQAKKKNHTLTKAELHDIECLYCHMEKQPTLELLYFNTNLVAYVAGLATTVGVMYAFKAAQPALLYLVPACLGTSLLLSIVRGDFPTLRKYTENEEEQASSSSSSSGAAAAPAAVKAGEAADDSEGTNDSTLTQRAKQASSSKKKRSARAD